MEKPDKVSEEEKIKRIIKKKTIVSFSVLAAGIVTGIVLWQWIGSQGKDNGQPQIFRRVLKANEKINKVFFEQDHLAKEYPKEKAAKDVRVNGDVGMSENFKPEDWSLLIIRNSGGNEDSKLMLGLEDIKALPKREIVFDFKCIEGWSQISYWGGTKFLDFMIKYKLGTHSGRSPDLSHPEDLFKYVGLKTADGKYYVGVDMKSMIHPQTILSYELNAKPLPLEQGYPLRLIIPVKYGIKHLKRIGTIFFSDTRPPDYWYERGYDYDSAL